MLCYAMLCNDGATPDANATAMLCYPDAAANANANVNANADAVQCYAIYAVSAMADAAVELW